VIDFKLIHGEAFGIPYLVSPHFASLAGDDEADPVRRQFYPDPREKDIEPISLSDPLGEARFRATPRLIHQYDNRALLLTVGTCAGYCRHCFRRMWAYGEGLEGSAGRDFVGDRSDELQAVCDYLAAHRDIHEILISGGDPLTVEDEKLEALFKCLRQASPGIGLRICSRVPITAPLRITSHTIAMLKGFAQDCAQDGGVRFAVHINHPRELETGADGVNAGDMLHTLVEAGFPVLVQTVLLKGVNDNVDTLCKLFRRCLSLGLKPYYLFQTDLARGTKHFRVPLMQGLKLYENVKEALKNDEAAGKALPPYAVDGPGGGGKIRLSEAVITGPVDTSEGKMYQLKAADGSLWPYPAD
jgi:lysine 2,3-aminomutase